MSKRRSKRARRQKNHYPRLVLVRQIILGSLLFLALGFFGYGVWYGTRLPAVTLTTITVVGGETVQAAAITEQAEAVLEGSYFHLIPYRFSYLYPRANIAAAIAEHPRVKQVYVERTSRHELTIAFEEYRPVALWCLSPEATDCLFLDKTGYAFVKAPVLEGAAFVRYVDSNAELAVGTSPFVGDRIVATNAFIDQVHNDLAINITAVERQGRSDLRYHVAGGGEILVSEVLPLSDTLVNLATILQSPEFEHLEPGSFRYIDLRFGNKIFINEELDTVTTTPTATEAVGSVEIETTPSSEDGAE